MTMAKAQRATPGPFYQPYANPATNHIYNLLFCDNVELFRHGNNPFEGPPAVLTSTDRATLEKTGSDGDIESRVRMLAFNRLRALQAPVPPKCLLGTVIELPQQQGLDVLAAFADGGLRYINYTATMAVFESTPPGLGNTVDELKRLSRLALDRIGPWEKPRQPPPENGFVRMTFLVSDGLYVGEGPFADIQRDPITGPIIRASHELLNGIIQVALAGDRRKA